MKAETSPTGPKFNLMEPDGERTQQVDNEQISQVLLNDGQWYSILPGSFKFYQTAPGPDGKRAGVPFVQFDLNAQNQDGQTLRIEVFPATVAGWAYTPTSEQA